MQETSPLIPPEDPAFAGQPLAARMRPSTLEEFAGQKHLIGEGKVLRCGPPGEVMTETFIRKLYSLGIYGR